MTDLQYIVGLLACGVARTMGIAIFLPLLARRHFPALVRNAICLGLAWPEFITLYENTAAFKAISSNILIYCLKETFLGAVLGIGLSIPIWAANAAMTFVDNQRGINAAQMSSPVMAQDQSILGELTERLMSTIMIELGFITLLASIVSESYIRFPIENVLPLFDHALQVEYIKNLAQIFLLIVKWSAPMILLMVVIDFSMGIISSNLKGLDIYFLATPIKIISSSILIVIFIVPWSNGLIKDIEFWWIDLLLMKSSHE